MYLYVTQNILRRGESAAPVDIVAKAKLLLEKDLKEQRKEGEYLPRRPSVLSSRDQINLQLVFDFGGNGVGASAAGASPSPAAPPPSPFASRRDARDSPVPSPNPHAKPPNASYSQAVTETVSTNRRRTLKSFDSTHDDGDNTDYDNVPDEPVSPASKVFKRHTNACEQSNASAAKTSSQSKTTADFSSTVPQPATTTKSLDVRDSSQGNARGTPAATPSDSRQSSDSPSSSQTQLVQPQPVAKATARSTGTSTSSGGGGGSTSATGSRSVIMKIASAAMGHRAGGLRVHPPIAAHINSQRNSSTNTSTTNNKSSSYTTIKTGQRAIPSPSSINYEF